MLEYLAEDLIRELNTDQFVARYRDTKRFAECCRACPSFGRSWCCPPFEPASTEWFGTYARVMLVATVIRPSDSSLPISSAQQLMLPERQRIERRLLGLEQQYGGRSAACVGECLYCPAEGCSRSLGQPCRHPELLRPSLEAYGFDLVRGVEELFGRPLLWSTDGLMPEYLILVSGFFHNNDNINW